MRSILLLLVAFSATTISAQKKGEQTLAQLQESPAGSRIIWFLDAVKAGVMSDEEIKTQFSPKLIDKISIGKLNASFADILENDGVLVLYSANRLNLTEYKLKLKGLKSGGWLDMKFFFEDSNPYRIAGFTIDTSDSGPNITVSPIYPANN